MASNFSVLSFSLEASKKASNQWTLLFIDFLILLLSLSIFPFYLHVYRSNKERDKSTAVFQIINHFHGCKKLLYSNYAILLLLILLTFIFPYSIAFPSILYSWFTVTLCYAILICEINQFLLGLLAIQRFFIYFFPSSEKILNFGDVTMNWIVGLSYTTSVIGKMVLCYFCSPDEYDEIFFDFYFILFYFVITDAIVTPFIIQLTYLGCNRRNMMSFMTFLKLGGGKMCCMFCKATAIEPASSGIVNQLSSTVVA
ncbi:hypothetical protein CAEBREN_08604 [Caenorhabditis brenneri]|uniref:Uncharacterized protein n=1 Tax=Caenorhabditis brenneri TaxID=135651 RepID=G0N1E2_CAEBE|nr:hypothetical protein CAEBREN_08604 [Caenorhabditis brenneri]